jgi:hypothetical protein
MRLLFALRCAALLMLAGASEQRVTMETGLAAVAPESIDRWVPVRFSESAYLKPTVFAGMATSRDSGASAAVAVVHVANVTAKGFLLRVTVAGCLQTTSGAIDVPWLVSEVGVHYLCDVKVEASAFTYGGELRSALEFSTSFLVPPTVLLQIQAGKPEPGTVDNTARLLKVSNSGFGAQLQAPTGSRVSYVAFEQGGRRGPNFHQFHANVSRISTSVSGSIGVGTTTMTFPHQVYEHTLASVLRTNECGW